MLGLKLNHVSKRGPSRTYMIVYTLHALYSLRRHRLIGIGVPHYKPETVVWPSQVNNWNSYSHHADDVFKWIEALVSFVGQYTGIKYQVPNLSGIKYQVPILTIWQRFDIDWSAGHPFSLSCVSSHLDTVVGELLQAVDCRRQLRGYHDNSVSLVWRQHTSSIYYQHKWVSQQCK